MNKIKLLSIVAVIVLLLVGAMFFIKSKQIEAPVACTEEAKLCSDGTAVGRTGPLCEFAECPVVQLQTQKMSFDKTYTLKMDTPITFSDGLNVTLKKIDDSRCKEGVQCIWAGELNPVFNAWGGTLGEAVEEVRLGTTTTKSMKLNGYTFVLNSATENTATVIITKNSSSDKGSVLSGYVTGYINIGPFCPVERVDQPCPVPASAYSSREVIVYASDAGTIIKKGKIDAQGNYKIALSPGKYFIQINPAGIGAGEKKQAIITSEKTITVDFDIDTGIR